MAKNTGIFKAKYANGKEYYRVSVTYHGKHISLGSFNAKRQAASCYKEAKDILSGSYTPDDYPAFKAISFDKFIILINFRDNNVYFKNPIYIKPGFFLYYLSYDYALKFSKDDLFFYSAHKIMKRGNHLFVNDYGSQESLGLRYGIMSYAVENRDYEFINKDRTDYRYENIRIINRYTGVRKIEKDLNTVYEARIHINNYIRIGIYDNEIKAAIAYNKAADILIRNGIGKNYHHNFISGLSDDEYQAIYDELPLSSKIYKF